MTSDVDVRPLVNRMWDAGRLLVTGYNMDEQIAIVLVGMLARWDRLTGLEAEEIADEVWAWCGTGTEGAVYGVMTELQDGVEARQSWVATRVNGRQRSQALDRAVAR